LCTKQVGRQTKEIVFLRRFQNSPPM